MRLKIAWRDAPIFLAVLFLPITSLPWLSRLLGGTLVAPPSSFLLALAFLGLLPVLRAWRWPREIFPWLAFLSSALFSTGLAAYRGLLPFKGHPWYMEALQAIFTLGLGSAVYLTVTLWLRCRADFVRFLRWLNWAGVIMIVWGLLQAFVIFFHHGQYPDWMIWLHGLINPRSLTALTFRRRVAALAFEPSWLAHMLNVLFFPYWLGATLTGYSAFRWRLGRFSLENVLLAGGFVLLLASFSRIGLLGFFAMTGFLLLVLARRLGNWGQQRFSRRWLGWALPFLALLTFFVAGVGLVWLLSLRDPRLAQIFSLGQTESFYALARQLKFGERVVYWAMGWQIFAAHPLLGVGLGGAGFYATEFLPDYAWQLPEVINALVWRDFVLNTKNLWVRLLAETGLAGFSAFVTWLVLLTLGAWRLLSQRDALWRALGWMGLLGLVALLGEGFSLDTFGLPYYWVCLGLVTAASLYTQRLQQG